MASLVLIPLGTALTEPAPPAMLVSWSTEDGVLLEWDAPAEGDPPAKYRIYRSLNGSAPTLIAESTVESYLDTEVSSMVGDLNVTVYFVTSVAADGSESQPSNPTTPGPYPYCFPLTLNEPFLKVDCVWPPPPPPLEPQPEPPLPSLAHVR